MGLSASPCCLGNCPTDKRLARATLPSLLSFVLLQIPFLALRRRYLQICSSLALHLPPMAPCKVKTSSAPAWYEPALEAPTVTEKSLASVRLLTAGESNEWGKTELRLASDEPEPEGSTFFPFFSRSVAVGLVPPFSDFFYEVLDHYGLQALHLHPNSVLLLSIFAYYCEAYLGVMPSVALLRHFFFLRVTGEHITGCANFVACGKANSI